MNEQTDPNNTEFVLPIICHKCNTELNLSMEFALLASKDEITNKKTNEDITEEDKTE